MRVRRAPMRRFHVAELRPGRVALDPGQSRHAARVLRLRPGDTVELFDGCGHRAAGTIVEAGRRVLLEVAGVETAPAPSTLIVAAAVPKGRRADVMIEKLSELGVAAFQPVLFERGVRAPQSRRRFERIAVESAKQCGRAHVMEIRAPAWPQGRIVVADPGAPRRMRPGDGDVAVVGPEGGLTDAERARLAGATFASLGPTILRIETAAIAAAAVLLCADI